MPWAPTTDFEEEIINLQPDHDFIYGGLSEPEPQPGYPRPKSHVEFAFNNRKEAKKQQELYEATGRMNEKLHVITQVQRMAGTKPLGEQPTLHDWDSNKNVEKETISMMRFCGMGPSLEEPLNNKVTIATYPVENNIRIIKNGRKKVPVFFDENVFKLKPKVSNSSSGIDSATSSINSSEAKDDSISSQGNQSTDTSFNTSASSMNNSISFYTGENNSQDSNNSVTAYKKAQMERESLLLKAERMQQYDKLQEEMTGLSISNVTQENDSFKSAKDFNPWTGPCVDDYDEDDSFNKNKVNWPPIQCNEFKTLEKWHSAKRSSSASSSTTTASSLTNNTIDTSQKDHQNYSGNTSEISSTIGSSLSKNFLERFITPTKQLSETTTSPEESFSSSSSSLIKSPSSYADMAKKSLPSQGAKPKSKKNIALPPMPRFYTARQVYDMKRRVEN